MNTSKSFNIKAGIILSFVTLVVNILIYIFYTPFLLKIVGDTQYGLYSFAVGITSWFSFASSSMAIGYTRFFAVSRNKKSKFNNQTLNGAYFIIFAIYSFLILLASAIFVILILSGIITFDKYTIAEQNLITILFVITILSLIPTLLFQVFSSSIYAHGKFVWYRSVSILSIIFRTGISIPFLLFGCDIISVVLIHGIVNVIFILADIIYAYFGLKLRFDFKKIKENKFLFKEIFLFIGALLINEIADRLNASLDSVILGYNGLAVEVTHYALGMRIADYLVQAVLTVAKNFTPTINENAIDNKHRSNVDIFIRISKIQIIITALLIGGFCVCGKEFILLWLGNGYDDVYYICIVLSILYSYISTTVISEDIERANNKHLGRSIIMLCTCVFNAILTHFLLLLTPKKYAIFMCLLSTSLCYFFGYFICLSIYHQKSVNIPMKLYWKQVFFVFVMIFPSILFSNSLYKILPFNLQGPIVLMLLKGITYVISFTILCFLFFKKDFKIILKNKIV